jgi:hypothetical protein
MPPPEDVPGMPPAGRGDVAPPPMGAAGFGAMGVAMAGCATGRGAG